MKISAIICTHNTREDHLQRTLDSLRKQTLDCAAWELLVIDNRSETPVSGRFDVSWHPHGKIIREDNLGLIHARKRGIRDSQGEVICYIDDDNVLAPDYLAEAVRIGAEVSHLGAWGGEILAEYEFPPAPWFFEYQSMLVIRPMDRDAIWGNAYRYASSAESVGENWNLSAAKRRAVLESCPQQTDSRMSFYRRRSGLLWATFSSIRFDRRMRD